MKNQPTLLPEQNYVQNSSREVEKNKKKNSDRNFTDIVFNLYDAKSILSLQYFFQKLTNERVINRIFDKMFEEIDSFSNR